MLPISELVSVARTLADDGSSPFALQAARAWSYERVRFMRSSANHVFVCSACAREPAVLRLRPEAAGEKQRTERCAELAAQLAAVGAPCVRAIATTDGKFTASVVDGEQRYIASLFLGVDGEQHEAESLAPDQAAAWGRGLALLHEVSSSIDASELPEWTESVGHVAKAISDPGVRKVAGAIVEALAELPSSPATVGVVHGDPELDNVIWREDGTPLFVDLDDAGRSWFASDIGFALRDFAPRAAPPDFGAAAVVAFFAGYREVRPLEESELASLQLFARAHALVTLARLEDALNEGLDPGWPDWALALRRRLEAVANELRTALTAGR